MTSKPIISIRQLSKRFILHHQDGAVLDILNAIDLDVHGGEVKALTGPSGAGKSSLLKAIYGTYRVDGGSVVVRHEGGETDIATAAPREISALRVRTIGYVSQFLRVIPRVPALEIVAEPAIELGMERETALHHARDLLQQLRIPDHLLSLSPLTFSGGEQQRVNIARAVAAPRALMLFDEPTASLDPVNRQTVLKMIAGLRDQGIAVLGIFHDPSDRQELQAKDVQILPSKELVDA